MGQREFRHLYMYAVLWDPQKSWGTHIKGDILYLTCQVIRFHIQIYELSSWQADLDIQKWLCLQVRSATLDTWLPEQVAFIHCKLFFQVMILNFS